MSSTRPVLATIAVLCVVFVGASCWVSWANLAAVSSSEEATAEQGPPPQPPAEQPSVAKEEHPPPAAPESEPVPPTETAYSVGTVAGLQGVSLVTVTVLTSTRELKKGDSVSLDSITTTENSKLWLKLKEGTDVSLGQHSGVRIVYLDVSDSGTVFHVHVAEARCPPGQRCVQGRCLPVVR